MTGLLSWARGFVLAYGGPGLFVVAFLDSSFLSLPEINDLLVIWMVAQHKERFAYYAIMATLGSIAGCAVLYWLAWKGGEAFLRKRFRAEKIEWAMQSVRRFGGLALFVPSLLPPPAPFKIFVLLAGVARVRPLTFALAIGVGRGLRYFAEALLTVWYGDAALDYVRAHGDHVALGIALTVLACGVAWAVWRRRRSRPAS